MLDFLRKTVLTLLIILGCSTATAKDISIFVATDLHVMSPDLIVNKGTAWDKYINSSHKLEDYSVALFQNMIDSILAQMPDIVLIPGDISKDGEKVSHEYVAKELSRLTDVGIKVYVVPGNHDIGPIENALYFDGDKRYHAENITADQFAELYADFGFNGTARDENSLSYAVEPIAGLVILCIDSHTSIINPKELDWICEQAKIARANNKQVIAMMHHPIMEHFNHQKLTKYQAILTDADSIRPRLMDAGIRVVFTGHFHTTDIAMDYNENYTDSIFDITTSSKISYPMHHRCVALSEDMNKMHIKTFGQDSIEGCPGILDIAKERIANNIDRKLESYDMQSMSSIAKKAVFIHCEGNENEANGVSLIDSIPSSTFQEVPEAWNVVNSLLDDYSFFGKENQNRINDLELTIDLSHGEIENPENIEVIHTDNKKTECYNLMGQQANEMLLGIVVQNGKKYLLNQ